MTRLQFKFRADADAQARREAMRKARKAGAKEVRPLFPGEEDPDLGSLYIVEVEGEAAARAVSTCLNAESAVEFVEREVKRKLRDSP